jgi:hypothetical protein
LTSAEQWRPVVGFEGYEVSSLGHVRSWLAGRVRGARRTSPFILRPSPGHNGYLHVSLFDDAGAHPQRVNRLVLRAFIGPCPAGHEGAHVNGTRTDNRLSNLEWKTRVDNHADKRIHGTLAIGERNGFAHLQATEVNELRLDRVLEGLSGKRLGNRYGVSDTAALKILKWQMWRDLPLSVKTYGCTPIAAAELAIKQFTEARAYYARHNLAA